MTEQDVTQHVATTTIIFIIIIITICPFELRALKLFRLSSSPESLVCSALQFALIKEFRNSLFRHMSQMFSSFILFSYN
jgi:hypothetical protein